MKNTIKTSDIKVEFGGDNLPKDQKFIDLYKDALGGKFLVTVAMIKMEGIEPFSDFKPKISDGFRSNFEDLEKQDHPPQLHVYPNDGKFIMSDDYNAYYLYIEKNYSKVICLVLGDAEGEFVLEKSEPFKMPVPINP